MAEKIGIFGGTFNPIHSGHLNSLRAVREKFKLSKIFIVPNYKNPLKESGDPTSPEDRTNMIKLAIKDDKKFFVDEQEIERKGESYSIETIKFYESKYGAENIYFILGVDSFLNLDKWKDYQQILKSTNFIITTRPGADLPFQKEEFPEKLQKYVQEIEPNGTVALSTDRFAQYIQLEDVDISSTQVRKRLKLKRAVDQVLTFEVEQYIKEKELYAPLSSKIPDFETFTYFCAQSLYNRKAISPKAYDLRKLAAPSEFSLVCSGTSTKQASSMAEQLVRDVKEEFAVAPLSLEGQSEGRWVLVDYGSLIVHVFYDFVRNEYKIEDLWKSGKELDLKKVLK